MKYGINKKLIIFKFLTNLISIFKQKWDANHRGSEFFIQAISRYCPYIGEPKFIHAIVRNF